MPFRVALAASAAILAASPVAAQSLPSSMLGTWADEARNCEDEASDGRTNVGPRSVELFASTYEIRTWRRIAATWVGRGRVHSEGEVGTTPGSIRLRLRPDGRLAIETTGSDAAILVRCPRFRDVR